MGLIARSSVFHGEYARHFPPIMYQLAVAAGVDPSTAAVIPARAGYAICIQRVTFNVTTDAAKVLIVRDDATTPLNAAIFPSSPGIGTRQIAYEEMGMQLTTGKNVDISQTGGAGLAGTLVIEGYYFPVGPFTPATV